MKHRQLEKLQKRMGSDLEDGEQISLGVSGQTSGGAKAGILAALAGFPAMMPIAVALGWIKPRFVLASDRHLYVYAWRVREGKLVAKHRIGDVEAAYRGERLHVGGEAIQVPVAGRKPAQQIAERCSPEAAGVTGDLSSDA